MLPAQKGKEWVDARRSSIGGSDANIIMSGDREKILDLWRVKTGGEPEDLSDVFAVQLGTVTEDFNLSWFEKKTGITLDRGVSRANNAYSVPLTATLDGEGIGCIVEAKHVSHRFGLAATLAKYQAQLHHNMICARVTKAYLSVISGNEYDYVEVDYDLEYAGKLIEAEREFWECVTLKIPPSEIAIVTPPEATRTVDMTGNNEWADLAHEWWTTKDHADRFEKADKAIKKLIPADVRSASGHGIKVTRDKRGYLRVSGGLLFIQDIVRQNKEG